MHACKPGPRSFKYELMWERDPSLFECVSEGWKATPAESVHALKEKLGELASDLSTWDREKFGSVRQEIKYLKGQVEMLRSQPARLAPSHAEVKVMDRLVELYHREEILWRQRARLDWLVHGDKNTYFWRTYPMVSIPNFRSEYGLWTAFLALAVRLFLPFPGRVTTEIHTSCLKLSTIFDNT